MSRATGTLQALSRPREQHGQKTLKQSPQKQRLQKQKQKSPQAQPTRSGIVSVVLWTILCLIPTLFVAGVDEAVEERDREEEVDNAGSQQVVSNFLLLAFKPQACFLACADSAVSRPADNYKTTSRVPQSAAARGHRRSFQRNVYGTQH